MTAEAAAATAELLLAARRDRTQLAGLPAALSPGDMEAA